MVALLHLATWAVGLLAAAGIALGLALLLFPQLKQWPANFVQQHLFPDANQVLLKQAKAKASGVQRNVYRILGFGDSLTEGFTSGGINFHPYVKRLGDRIYAQMPQDWHLEVEEQGESGERVLISMKHRLQRTLDEHETAGRHYDWVLLLGGINDLAGDQSTADEVMQGLSVLTEACLRHGANVMLMTLMEVAEPEPKVEQQRQQLNELIRQYVKQQSWTAAADDAAAAAAASSNTNTDALQQQQQQSGAAGSGSSTPVSRRGAPRVVLFDLAVKLTWNGMDEETRWQMWDDGVHLTIDGYDLMGDLIVEALAPLVTKDIGASSATAAAAAAGAVPAAVAAGGSGGGAVDARAAVVEKGVAAGHKKAL